MGAVFECMGAYFFSSPPLVVIVMMVRTMIADIYISISMETFDIENIKYEKTLATVRFRYIL